MGMFNSIFADLLCPDRGEISQQTEIQIKWQIQAARQLEAYSLGDTLPDIEPEYNNTWVRTDYICNVCSPKTKGRYGDYIRTDDQRRHLVFVEIRDARICRILTEAEFAKLGAREFVDYL